MDRFLIADDDQLACIFKAMIATSFDFAFETHASHDTLDILDLPSNHPARYRSFRAEKLDHPSLRIKMRGKHGHSPSLAKDG